MRRFLNILILGIFLAAGAGCTVYDTADSAVTSNAEIHEGIFSKVMTPFCRIVDLSDFYFRYRSIGEYGPAADDLKDSYFGETVSMQRFGEDGIEIEYWGKIDLRGSEKEYRAVLSSHWMGLEPSYSITVIGSRMYDIVYNSEENAGLTAGNGYDVSLEGEVEVVGYHAALRSLDVYYTETSFGRPLEIRVTAGTDNDTVMLNLCQGGEYMVYPVAGILYYSVSGYITDSFKVVFYGDHFEVVDGDMTEPDPD